MTEEKKDSIDKEGKTFGDKIKDFLFPTHEQRMDKLKKETEELKLKSERAKLKASIEKERASVKQAKGSNSFDKMLDNLSKPNSGLFGSSAVGSEDAMKEYNKTKEEYWKKTF